MTGKDRDYTSTGQAPWKSPVLFSVVLHGMLLVVVLVGWQWSTPVHEDTPRSIAATLVLQQPESVEPPTPAPTPQPDPAAQQRRQEEAARQAAAEAERRRQAEREEQQRRATAERERQRQAEAEEAARLKAAAEAEALARQRAEEQRRREQEQARQAEEQRRQEQERQRAAEEERQRREAEARRLEAERQLREQQLEAIAEQAARDQAEAERQRAAAAAAARVREAQMLSEKDRYLALIRSKLSRAWYKPPSATESMEARLQITLLPTGELARVELVQGSGNAAFDNSALSAARSIGNYPVPQERDTFERYFRQFTIRFTPRELR
ncbi:cell envelope integrity protein TolA [Marinobacter mobilis]|uniref:Cell division and transport-associated protein TolA (TC 2.C.1.2.1) n=1 Tax=Marinobacter mobilis TaxID=488533 RepID=A0A1H2US65_9GAMM|nr:cell envelope integrity protein TolA [Marinobacter mobilis]SDW58890.1 Cell division and transport-associated protein TolA (TC 2.C.1.2.1) [Marinobacter mobilis]